MMMKKHLKIYLILVLVIFGGHVGINATLPSPISFLDILYSHLVLILVFSLGIFVLHTINKVDKEKVGITFLGLSVVKMLIALTFILVQIKMFGKPNALAYHFLLVYFLNLVIVSVFTFKIVNSNNYLSKAE